MLSVKQSKSMKNHIGSQIRSQ